MPSTSPPAELQRGAVDHVTARRRGRERTHVGGEGRGGYSWASRSALRAALLLPPQSVQHSGDERKDSLWRSYKPRVLGKIYVNRESKYRVWIVKWVFGNASEEYTCLWTERHAQCLCGFVKLDRDNVLSKYLDGAFYRVRKFRWREPGIVRLKWSTWQLLVRRILCTEPISPLPCSLIIDAAFSIIIAGVKWHQSKN